jgi:hypothetical protein
MSDAIQFHSRVGDDGVLNVQVNLGHSEAARDVVITIEPLPHGGPGEHSPKLAWNAFVEQTYGSCANLGLERHQQGSYESRELIE